MQACDDLEASAEAEAGGEHRPAADDDGDQEEVGDEEDEEEEWDFHNAGYWEHFYEDFDEDELYDWYACSTGGRV